MIANSEIQKLYRDTQRARNYVAPESQVFSGTKALNRIKVVNIIAIIITLLVASRLIYLNTYNNTFLTKQMNTRVLRTVKVTAMRGTIVDRNANALAVSSPVASIWVDPSELNNLNKGEVNQIAKILEMPVAELNTRLNEKNKTFVYIKRAVSPKQALQIKNLDISGIYSIQEFKRFYPNGEVTAHVVGFNNVDDRGADGIEYANDKSLLGINGSQQILRDRQGHVVENLGKSKAAINGQTVYLSIDNRIQYIAYNALKQQIVKTHAKSGSAVVLDAKTGEVLSMVNMPTYNPNNRGDVTPNKLKNSAVTNVYDPGSIMKPIVVAKALDDKIVTPQTIINTNPYSVGPKLIKDDEPFPQLSVEDILIRSSDIGTSKIALKYKPDVLYSYYRKVGFGEKLNTGFPGETNGIMISLKKLRPIDQALNSFGYGISVSLLQMAHAYTMFTNKGCIVPVSFYKIDKAPDCTPLISPHTADTVRGILAKNTVRGTGKNAQLDNYTAAGKTGTAQKIINGHYSNRNHIASFVGFAPATNPKVIVAVMIDEPKKEGYYGAVVAAPVFNQIAGPALHVLGIKPDKQ